AQATREARLAVADDVIDNPDAIPSDFARLHAHYLQLASQFGSQEKP
ncbi:dephospho-CoA kinase, partial [Escherichia coli]|nr:dephospho-CoA kinase [Escherichia coli]